MLKTMWKDNIRTIFKSLSRFLSIVMMVFLGVAFFVGLKTAGPSIIKTSQSLIEATDLPDGIIRYPTGLDQDVLNKIKEKIDLEIKGIRSTDANAVSLSQTLRVYSMENNEESFFKVVDGSFPKETFEIALDRQLLDSHPHLSIGNYLSLDDLKELQTKEIDLQLPYLEKGDYKIVGFLESPLYLSNLDRGMQFDGQGTITGYGIVCEENMEGDAYSEGFYWVSQLGNYPVFSNDYDHTNQSITNHIENQLEELSNEILNDFQQPKLKGISDKKEKLEVAHTKKAISKQEYEQQNAKLIEAEKEIEELDALSFVTIPREDFSGYRLVKNNASKMEELSNIFPVFFFILAMVVTYIAMTRMAQEEQIYIGTMKQMGYTNRQIVQKFVIYSLLSVGLGIVLGIFVGVYILPSVILSAYETLHPLTEPIISLNWQMITYLGIGTLLLGLIPSILTPLILVRRPPLQLLKETTHTKSKVIHKTKASRVNYQLLWIGRSIKDGMTRSLIMIFALTAATMLLVAGFGLVDSLNGTLSRQFDKITHYTSIMYVDSEKSTDLEKEKLPQLEDLEFAYPIHLSHAEIIDGEEQGLKFQIMVPLGKEDKFIQAVTLVDESEEIVSLDEDLSFVTPVLANSTNKVISRWDNEEYHLDYHDVVQNYVGNYLFMPANIYKEVKGTDASKNAFLVKYSLNDQEKIEEELLDLDGVQSIFNLEQMKETAEASMESLNMITVVLIVAAACLTFIILYNLMNIMLNENYKELATLKVLGLFDYQVSRLTLIETGFLSTLGIIIGTYLGYKLNGYVIALLSRDDLMFYPQILPLSYGYSIALAYIFILIVGLVIHLQIKKIDKVEAMKDAS